MAAAVSAPSASADNNFELHIDFFRAKGVDFSHAQIRSMVARTNRKLSPAKITIKINKIHPDLPARFASVGQKNLENILKATQEKSQSALRVVLVHEDLEYKNGSWTYDPVDNPEDRDLWQGIIFITDEFSEATDEAYQRLGYPPENDTLLHELGHVLMQRDVHVKGTRRNFFHDLSERSSDHMTPSQMKAMRASEYLKSPSP